MTSWKLEKDTVQQAGTGNAGAIGTIAAAQVDFDLAASAVRTSSDELKVIMWHTAYDGAITRLGDANGGSCL